MSDDFWWRKAQPKKPPPERGIKLKNAGTTWWGQRWIEALEHVLRGDAGRLARGRTYARAGRTHDLTIHGGKVSAKVTGSRAQPYDVRIELSQLSAATWDGAIAHMAAKAQFAVELLAGRMPQAIDEAFHAAGASLFPQQRRDLVTDCSCPDYGDPCKHIAATHYVLGQAFDGDPFLLFELRGRTKTEVLDALRLARVGARVEPAAQAVEVESVSFGPRELADYERAPEPLSALQFSFDAPDTHAAVLRQLGAPAAWSGEMAAADVLEPLLQAAAETARKLALADVEVTRELPARAPKAPVRRARSLADVEVTREPAPGLPARARKAPVRHARSLADVELAREPAHELPARATKARVRRARSLADVELAREPAQELPARARKAPVRRARKAPR